MRRIRRRLLFSFLALVLLTVVVLALVSGTLVRGTFLDHLESDLGRQAREFAATLNIEDLSAFWIDPVMLQRLTKRAGKAGDLRLTVIARDGTVLADSEEDPKTMANLAGRPEVRRAFAGGEGRARRASDAGDDEIVYVAVPLEESQAAWSKGAVRVAVPASLIDPELARIYRLPFLVALVILGPALLLVYLLSRSLTQPIGRLRDMAVAMAQGDLTHRISLRRPDELSELGEALNSTAEELEGRISLLAAEREQVTEILAVMADGVLVLDERGTMVRANQAAGRILATGRRELEGVSIVHACRAFPGLELLERSRREGQAFSLPLELPGSRWILTQVIPLRLSPTGGRRTLILLHDETDRINTERMRRDFVANVSHELKTPLSGMALLAGTLRHAIGEDPLAARDFAARLSVEISRLTELVNDLLTLCHLEEHPSLAADEMEPVNLADVAREAAAEMADFASQRGVTIESSCTDAWVLGDQTALDTLTRNLLDNAIRYNEQGGHAWVTVSADTPVANGRTPAGTLRPPEEEPTAQAHLVVRDDGIGIPADQQSRIFERFYRVDKARSRETGGTGLGLSIVRHVVEQHGGRIEVESTVGVGSTFSVHLPLGPRP